MLIDEFTKLDRRGFLLSASAAGLLLPAPVALASDGGGGFDLKIAPSYSETDEPEDEPQGEAHIYTQNQFLNMSRKRSLMYAGMPNAFVRGFSPRMSRHVFLMGYYNQRGVRKVVRVMITITVVRDRRSYLRDARNMARNDLRSYQGNDAGREARQVYYNGLKYWTQRPREGTLKLNYNF